ncbi:MAG TPA: hypothetical protein VK753_03400, partial [Xanthomonadaceae bacterium]|nr:hypothetical protein [Xanthomonadaceae bacterium]
MGIDATSTQLRRQMFAHFGIADDPDLSATAQTGLRHAGGRCCNPFQAETAQLQTAQLQTALLQTALLQTAQPRAGLGRCGLFPGACIACDDNDVDFLLPLQVVDD